MFEENICLNNFYYSTICHVCKSYSIELKRCSVCKTIAYCSKDHQKIDWHNHKSLCKVISKISKTIKCKVGCSKKEWKFYRLSLQAAWLVELKRNLQPFECHMWMFPRSCAICYTSAVVQDCEKCLSVSYCSKEHEEEHKTIHKLYCDKLKLSLDIYCYLWNQKIYPTCKLNSISSYHKQLPSNIEALMEDILLENSKDYIQYILKTDLLAPCLTILYALEKSGLVKKRNFNKDKLIVHLVGASQTEITMDWSIITEFIFHWLVNLKQIKLILVGPEAVEMKIIKNFCHNCQINKKLVTVNCYKCFYHQIIKQIDKPDIVVAFNCGLHEYENTNNTWKQSIPFLLNYLQVPLLITAYTEQEIKLDLNNIKSVHKNFNFILHPQKNHFASLRPLRDCDLDECDQPLFYINNYISVVMKKNIDE